MNEPYAASAEDKHRKVSRAFLSLARQQRRQAHQYRHWAQDAKADGNMTKHAHWRGQALRYWNKAKAALSSARYWEAMAK